jgi:hypothetical protein
MKSEQEIFDTVALHLIKQGKQSIDADGNCLFRGPNGLKCAVGCLIPDEVYRPEMEDESVSDLMCNYDALNFLNPNALLLSKLQSAHDREHPEYQTWMDAVILHLRKIAEKYNLSVAVLDT